MFESKQLDEKELAAMSLEVKESIITARIGLLLRHPWFGNMATRLIITQADNWCPTAACNGKELFYNTQFFHSLALSEVEFVVAHEILHSALDHIFRGEHRNRTIFNIACDYVVNNILVRDKIGERPKGIDIFQDFKYDGWTAEDIYDELLAKTEEQLGKLGEMLDEHVDWEDGGTNSMSAGGDASGEPGPGVDGPPVLSKEEMNAIKDDVKENMISAAQSTGAGNIPMEINRLIKELTESKIDWRDLLQQQIQSTVRSNYSFARPSRKGWGSNIIIPGMEREEAIEIAVSMDMSGSINDEQARDFLSEVRGIMDQYSSYKIDVWTFDTKVYNHVVYTEDNADDIAEYDLIGGGGTDFECVWTYMKENNIVPRKLIMFTDMYAWNSFGDPIYCDTIFINHGREGFEAPFGITVPYAF